MRLPRNLLLIYLVVVGTYTAEGFINVVFTPYLQQQGVGLAEMGAIVAALSLASLFSRLPAGFLYRPRTASLSIAIASAAVAAVTFAYPRTDSEPLLTALRLLHGFAFGVTTTLNLAQFFDTRPPSFERGRAMGLFAASLAFGNMIGNFVGGWWADTFGFEAAFTTAAIFPLVAAPINLQVRHEPAAARPQAKSTKTSSLHLALGSLRNPGIMLAALLLFCVNTLNQMFNPFINLYLLGIGVSLTVIGLIKGVSSLSSVFTRVFAGELGRWWSYDTISRVGLTASAVAILAVPTTTLLVLLAPLIVAVNVLRAILTVTGGVSVIDATDATAEQRGVASGLFNMGKDLGAVAGPFLGGLIAAQVGVGPMMQMVAVATLLLFWGSTALVEPRLRRARAVRAAASPESAAAPRAGR